MLIKLSNNAYGQLDTACASVLGQVIVNECTTYPLVPTVLSGQTVEKCFSFYPISPNINLSFIILNNTCGPVAPYTSLSFKMFNCTCDTLIQAGAIVPVHVNTNIVGLDTSQCYILCVTWTARCDQFSICPLIYDSPLPVELISFTGNVNKDKINFNWSTASEINSDRFEIYRSTDLNSYELINTTPAAGNSTFNLVYSAETNYDSKYMYYTLSEIDIDGTRWYNSTISLDEMHKVDIIKYYDLLGVEHLIPVPGINFMRHGTHVQKIIKID